MSSKRKKPAPKGDKYADKAAATRSGPNGSEAVQTRHQRKQQQLDKQRRGATMLMEALTDSEGFAGALPQWELDLIDSVNAGSSNRTALPLEDSGSIPPEPHELDSTAKASSSPVNRVLINDFIHEGMRRSYDAERLAFDDEPEDSYPHTL